MAGRYVGEDRRLVFGPPLAYHRFVYAVAAVGTGMMLLPFLAPGYGPGSEWWRFFGLLVLLSSVLASFSMQLIVFDLKEKTYRRRQGPGFLPRTTVGRFADLDAVVAITEPDRLKGNSVTYHVVLHWKQAQAQPVLVLIQDGRAWSPGLPLNHLAGPTLQLGHRYAQSLGLPFYDNTHFPSPCPVAVW